MTKIHKHIGVGLLVGACGVAACALAKKLKLTSRLAEFAHSIEGVPFPGVNLYSFLASRQLNTMYAQIADDIESGTTHPQILDLNTNVGLLPIEIAKRNSHAHVIGIDQSRDMLHIASANARARHVASRIDFHQGDPNNLPFPGRYFDLAISVNSLHHWSNPQHIFEEVYHILKPTGEFRIYDYRADVDEEVWEDALSNLPVHLQAPFMVGPWASSKAALQIEKVEDILKSTHFEDFKIEEESLTIYGLELPVFWKMTMRKPHQTSE